MQRHDAQQRRGAHDDAGRRCGELRLRCAVPRARRRRLPSRRWAGEREGGEHERPSAARTNPCAYALSARDVSRRVPRWRAIVLLYFGGLRG